MPMCEEGGLDAIDNKIGYDGKVENAAASNHARFCLHPIMSAVRI